MRFWIKIALGVAVVALVLSSIVSFVLSDITAAKRDAALSDLRAGLAPPANPVAPIEPSPARKRLTSSPDSSDSSLEDLRVEVIRLAAELRHPSTPDNPDLRTPAYDLYRALTEKTKTVAGLTEGELGLLREYLAQDEATWTTVEFLDWRRVEDVMLLPDTTYADFTGPWILARGASTRLAFQAILDLRQGDADAVYRDVTAWLRPLESAWMRPDEGDLMASLVRSALEYGPPSPEAEKELLARLSRNRQRDTFQRQRRHFAALFARMAVEQPQDIYMTGDTFTDATRRMYSTVGAPFYNADIEYFAANAQRVIDAAALPHLRAKAALQDLQDDLDGCVLGKELGRTFHLEQLAEPFDSRAALEAWIDLTRLAIVLERYRVDHGVYPETLAALEDSFPGGMPEDPFSGKPYLYTTDGESFRLASIFKHNPQVNDGYWDDIEWARTHETSTRLKNTPG